LVGDTKLGGAENTNAQVAINNIYLNIHIIVSDFDDIDGEEERQSLRPRHSA
jgi:hypothetical protein